MAFTRFHDDPARIIKNLEISTYAGRYALDSPGNGANPTYMQDPFIRMQKWGGNAMTEATEIENDLFGLTRNMNRDTFDNLYCKGNGTTRFPSDSRPVPSKDVMNAYTDQSRATHPAWILRDKTQHRPDYPLFNPQEHVAIPFQNNLSTRILEKDYFVPSIPTITNTTDSHDQLNQVRESIANSNSGMGTYSHLLS